MSIRRYQHDIDNPYTVISNVTLRDMTLSLKAKAILCICLSFSDQWQFNLIDLSKRFNTNKNTLNKCLLELEEKGYLTRRRKRNPNGKIIGVEYEFYEVPVPKKQDLDNSEPNNQDTENKVLVYIAPKNETKRSTKRKNYQTKKVSNNNVEKAKKELELLGRRLKGG